MGVAALMLRMNLTATLASEAGGAEDAPEETTAPCAATVASESTVTELIEMEVLDMLKEVARVERREVDSALELSERIEVAVAFTKNM